jgi:hypothetical protein
MGMYHVVRHECPHGCQIYATFMERKAVEDSDLKWQLEDYNLDAILAWPDKKSEK